MAEPGIDLHLDHLHRAWNAASHREIVETAHHPAEDYPHEARLLQRRAHPRRPFACCPPALSADAVRSGEAASNSRHGALEPGDRRPLGISFDRGLELLNGQQRRRDDRSRGPAAARARSFRQIGIPDPDLDLVRLQSEFVGHRIGDHGAAAGADVLDRGARDEASVLDRQFDLRAGLPEIKPVSGGNADAAAIAAGLRRRRPVAPDFEPGCPIVQTLAIGIGIPALAQCDRIELHRSAASSIACSSAKAIGGPPGPRNGAPGGRLLMTSKSASSLASAG